MKRRWTRIGGWIAVVALATGCGSSSDAGGVDSSTDGTPKGGETPDATTSGDGPMVDGSAGSEVGPISEAGGEGSTVDGATTADGATTDGSMGVEASGADGAEAPTCTFDDGGIGTCNGDVWVCCKSDVGGAPHPPYCVAASKYDGGCPPEPDCDGSDCAPPHP